jgi:UDP-N-acetylmuramate--alanine ligase
MELGLSFDRVAAGLKDFRGADRRFDVRGERNGILVVDDYGHHPTEIAAVLAAARTFNRRIVVAFQPHRFTRTKALMDAFGPALAEADHIVLTDIYSAGEDPIPGVTIDVLAAAVRRSVRATVDVETGLDDVVAAIVRVAKPGDVVITLGAGSIGTLPERLLEALGAAGGTSPVSAPVATEASSVGDTAPVPPGEDKS